MVLFSSNNEISLIIILVCTQVFPGDLLEHTHPDPGNPRELLARSEVRRRGNYFEYLERESYTGGVQATLWWVWSSNVWRISQKS